MNRNLDWTILLIGGGAGTGKTTLSIALGEQFGVRPVEGDLFFWVMRASIREEIEPDLYVFTHPEIWQQPTAVLVTALLDQSRRVMRGGEGAIARKDAFAMPAIFESIWVLPEFALQTTFAGRDMPDRVKSIFLYEPDVDILRERFRTRVPGPDTWDEAQELRLQVAYSYGLEIKRQADALKLPVIESRPFKTLVDRALIALGASAV